jgi:tetratricopeptide (TPR) repeat protein
LSSEEQSEWLCYHKLIGNKYYRCGNINKATEVYMDTLMAAKILKDDHTTVSVLCNLASCLIFQAQAAPAISLLNQALAITPGFPRALERRAAAYNLIGKIEEAEADLKTGINTVHEKTLENKMKNMLEKIQIDKRKKKEMYKKMIEPKKNIIIPDWVTKIIQLTIIPFTLINKLKSFCKRKQS